MEPIDGHPGIGPDQPVREDALARKVGLRVLVCGGRNYNNRDHIHNVLCDLDAMVGPISCIIHGCASGADSEAFIWSQMVGALHAPFRADWRAHGKAAGPIRNQRMIDEGKPDLVVAFPGGRGTDDMVRRARSAGVEVRVMGAPFTGIYRRAHEGVAAQVEGEGSRDEPLPSEPDHLEGGDT